jgi:hypothetical protein
VYAPNGYGNNKLRFFKNVIDKLEDSRNWQLILFLNCTLFNLVREKISCQFLPSSGSIGPRYVLQLLFSEKLQN